jgi:serine/threonine-protein kinase
MTEPHVISYTQAGWLKKILTSNLCICSILTLAIWLCMLLEFPPLFNLEKSTYGSLNRLRTPPASPVVLVEIDSKSLNELGAWPWPRSYISEMLYKLDKSGAKAIGLNILYAEREINPALDEIAKIRKTLRDSKGNFKNKNYADIDEELRNSAWSLDNDSNLINTIKAVGKVVLPFEIGRMPFNTSPSSAIDKLLKSQTLPQPDSDIDFFSVLKGLQNPFEIFQAPFISAEQVLLPFSLLSEAGKNLGHAMTFEETDQIVRRHPLFLRYRDRLLPSFPLQLASLASGTKLSTTRFITNRKDFYGIVLGNRKIPTDRQFNILINYDSKQNAFSRYSFSDISNNKVPANKLKDKIVLIGITAPGHYERFVTPLGSKASAAELNAQCTANISMSNTVHRPVWAWLFEAAAMFYFMFFLLFIIPRVSLKRGGAILLASLLIWLIANVILYLGPGYWFQIYGPFLLCSLGLVSIQFNRKFFSTQHIDEKTETNKTLGLTFQGQGMLDLAFDKFMKCSLKDPTVKDLLYNLGLDFERKRMHSKAVAVYEHIARAGKFKDLKERIPRLKDAEGKVTLGSPTPLADSTLAMDSAETLPTLGRYEVLKELGQGAVGTVYLGRDPKINREVAIKVLRYDEVSEDVTIYDVGEDYDLTYIAMELLNGKDLSSYCREVNRLPAARVLEIIGSVAEALDYAHKNGVVHRDIKPANIMLLEGGQIKVADFGIARITGSTRTQTGDIFGTPNYMSPEQVAGKKVDGRSDLFSLGAVMYELLSGEKPFQADTLAAIMYNIANANYVPLRKHSADSPKCCIKIVNKLLNKGVSKRFQSAAAVIQQINNCKKQLAE